MRTSRQLADLRIPQAALPLRGFFAITTDPFIVLTSNLFAILGLRAMYFLLADLGNRFELLKYSLAAILVFIGTKMLIVDWIKIPVLLSLAVVGTILAISVLASLWYASHKARSRPHPGGGAQPR